MEITSKFKDIETHHQQSPLNSPSSHGSSTTSNGPNHGPIPITRSDPNSPYPTTFVTADTSSFKQVVQMLTGSPKPKPDPIQPDPIKHHHQQQQQQLQQHNFVIPPVKTTATKPGFKLYERRNSSLKHMMISPLTPNYPPNYPSNHSSSFSPRNNHSNYHHFNHINGNNNNNNINNNNNYPLSPSLLDFPSLTLSPVTPLVIDTFDKSSSPSISSQIINSSVEEEDKAIAEKGFYLHPSPRDSNPKLLPLFPLSSPRVSDP